MDDKPIKLSLQLPQRTRSSLTFASADSRSIKSWLQSLPKTDFSQCSKALSSALGELAELNISAQGLLSLVELFRPVVYYVSGQVSRNKLPEGLLLGKEQRMYFASNQKLHERLLSCYKSVIQIAVDKHEGHSPFLDKPLHRAISDSGHLLLLIQEHYRNLPPAIWKETHQLVLFSEQQQLQDHNVDDQQTTKARKLTISDQYKRMLLLGHCRSNQLLHTEIRQVYKALCLWAPHARLQGQVDKSTWFVVNTEADAGLHYSLSEIDESGSELRGLNTKILSAHLKKMVTSVDGNKPGSLSPELLKHLAAAWGAPTARRHMRHPASGDYHISYGSSAAHYYLSEKNAFDDMVKQHLDTNQAGKSGFLPDKSSVWDDAHDADQDDDLVSGSADTPIEIQFENTEEGQSLYPALTASAINTSAIGFCLKLKDTPETKLRPGELVVINEDAIGQWSLGVVRWIHAGEKDSIIFGAELLSSSAKPCAIAPLKKTQNASHYQRAFVLPVVLALTDQPTLITSSFPFTSGMKFMLLEGGKIRKGQLLECVETTAGYSQYQFRLIENSL